MSADFPFDVRRFSKSISHPDEYDGSSVLSIGWDFEDGLHDSAKTKRILAWARLLARSPKITHLRVWSHVTQPLFEALCEIDGLQFLQLKWSNLRSLDGIERLSSLRELIIGSSTRIQSIEPLQQLKMLECLEIENFKSISDFAPLVTLCQLRSLAVTGSMWSRQAIESLEPFAQMTWLSSLCVDTSSVTSIQPLASLQQLKFLGIGGRLPYQEYAWLAAKLPETECHWFQPYINLSETGYSPCKSCGQRSMVMVTGKRKPVLCEHCDKEKLAKHIAMFEQARAEAAI